MGILYCWFVIEPSRAVLLRVHLNRLSQVYLMDVAWLDMEALPVYSLQNITNHSVGSRGVGGISSSQNTTIASGNGWYVVVIKLIGECQLHGSILNQVDGGSVNMYAHSL